MLTRRTVLTAAAVGAASVGFMLTLGWWRSAAPVAPGLLPLPLTEMQFTLTDHRGTRTTPQDWLGRPLLAFFGFTFCPDICPTTLSDISDWLEDLGTDADRLTVALISVDPERDSPQVLADYVSNFDPRITGFTGTPDQLARVAADFRAKFEKIFTDDGDYTMNHTAGVFLFHPDGSFGGIIDFHEDRRFAIPKIRRILT